MSVVHFLKVAAKDVRVAALTPSSSFVTRRILALLPSDTKTVVEYGPGDGVLTRALLAYLPEDGTLIAIETNPEFIALLQAIQDPRLVVVSGDARCVKDVLAAEGLSSCDVVLSGIPFTYFTPQDRAALAAATADIVRPGGSFIVYQFSLLMLKYLTPHFAVRWQFEPRNLPPYFIMNAMRRMRQ